MSADEITLPDVPCVLRAAMYASALSARYYGAPVYLVGGALTDPDPRDIDIVVAVDDDLFLAMYGADAFEDHTHASPSWQRWARDCAKAGREMTLYCRRGVDMKVQAEDEFKSHDGKPRLRLDCRLFDEPRELEGGQDDVR